jgi:hypothetical protein
MASVLSFLFSTTFLIPGLLFGLLALPVLWWLLRMTPPPPKREIFPAVRLLADLPREEETPARTPWWLLALRLLIAALIILGLAHPVSDPGGLLSNRDGTVILVVDDGWASAPGWHNRLAALDGLLVEAERQGRPTRLVTTAKNADDDETTISELMPARELRPLARALQPKPWATDRRRVASGLAALTSEGAAEIFWITDGLEQSTSPGLMLSDEFATELQKTGPVTVLRPSAAKLARTLTIDPTPFGEGRTGNLNFLVRRAGGTGPATVRLNARDIDGRILERQTVTFADGTSDVHFSLDIPADVRNRISQVEIENEASAAAVFLLDERWRRRSVGLATGKGEERDQPLLSSHYYLQKALEPIAETSVGDIDALLATDTSVMVLADIGRIVGKDRTGLQHWIEAGGVLVRFAGPGLAESGDDFVPVRLRTGNRVLAGAMTWSTPLKLAPFEDNSPFHGLPVPDDVHVRQQVLAEPASNLGERTWARLSDGTPIVTAEKRGQGWLVLVHATANGDWSNLPFSGLFVDMLERLINLAHGVSRASETAGALKALKHLDAFGHLQEPQGSAGTLGPGDTVGPGRPPGYYGTSAARLALNLGPDLDPPRAIPDLPVSISEAGLERRPELDFKPALLTLAALLLIADLLISLILRGMLSGIFRYRRNLTGKAGMLLLLAGVVLSTSPEAKAQSTNDEMAMAAALDTRLAYFITGNPAVDSLSEAGLAALTEVVRARTSVEGGPPMAVDPEIDELAFFPLIYWPVTADLARLSEPALARVDAYMKNGGTILFDTRDQQYAGIGSALGSATPERSRLQQLLRRLDIPPLVPVPQDHILTRAFYLMQAWPGRWSGGRVWVERHKGGVNDGVSSLVIGSHDWAAAWAASADGSPLAAVVQESPRQREMAYRFGVNVVMYVLTGNYKADQVHVPALLERLGQ